MFGDKLGETGYEQVEQEVGLGDKRDWGAELDEE
jgi:hypothetical protein